MCHAFLISLAFDGGPVFGSPFLIYSLGAAEVYR